METVGSARQVARHFADRGSDSAPLLVWVLHVVVTEMEAAADVLDGHPLATSADLAALEAAPRLSAKSWMSEAGIHEV